MNRSVTILAMILVLSTGGFAAKRGKTRMDWQDTLIIRLVDRIEKHALLSDMEPYRKRLELAAIESPANPFALESEAR